MFPERPTGLAKAGPQIDKAKTTADTIEKNAYKIDPLLDILIIIIDFLLSSLLYIRRQRKVGLDVIEEFRKVYLREIQHLEFFRHKPAALWVFRDAPHIRLETLKLVSTLLVYDAGELGIKTAIDLFALDAAYESPFFSAVSAHVMTHTLCGLLSYCTFIRNIAEHGVHRVSRVAAVLEKSLRPRGPAFACRAA